MRKIIFVIESLYLGGAEKSLITLLSNLDYDSYSVDLITFKEGQLLSFLPKEVNHIKMSIPKLNLCDRIQYRVKRKLNKSVHNAQLLWPLLEPHFKKNIVEYDVAVAYNQGLATYYVSQFILANKKLSWLNTDYEKANYSIKFDIPFYKYFTKIIAVSPEASLSLEKALFKISEILPIEVVKDITEEDIIIKQSMLPLKIPLSSNFINIVSVGRLVRYKGFHLAVEACEILLTKNYNIRWYVIGEGSERRKLEKLIKKARVENNFFLIGADTNPYPYMRACDIYVQTSLFEGLGLTIIEASILQKPIVSTNFPSIYSLITDEKTGLIANMEAGSIAAQIERLILDTSLRNKFSESLDNNRNNDKNHSLQEIMNLLNN